MESLKEPLMQWLSNSGMSQEGINLTEQLGTIAFILALVWIADLICRRLFVPAS